MKKIVILVSLAVVLGLVIGCPQANDGGGEALVDSRPADETTKTLIDNTDPAKPKNHNMTLIGIKGGTFTMGSKEGYSNAKPPRVVAINSFLLGETEVTQAQWEAVMDEWPGNDDKIYGVSKVPNERSGLGDDISAYYINWYDAVEFCNALSKAEGFDAYYSINDTVGSDENNSSENDTLKYLVTINANANGYRLPTEAEWEYAAGGGSSDRTVYAGTNNGTLEGLKPLGDYAWFLSNREGGVSSYFKIVGTTGSKTPTIAKSGNANTLGLFDMNGNVEEWCWDWYDNDYYSESGNTVNPLGPANGSYRVKRGGNFQALEFELRVAYRSYGTASLRNESRGFRVARNAN